MEELILKAPAKLNLHLQVLKKREDGFHDLSSLFTLINLYDSLIFKEQNKNIDLVESSPIENNIVFLAAKLLKEYSGTNKGASIELKKSIPCQKGLGGGSSDAAATLIGLTKLWKLNVSRKELFNIAIKLGSDVPFFLFGETAWALGRGEILNRYPYSEKYFLLFYPERGISTAVAFKEVPTNYKIEITAENYTAKKSFNSFEGWIRRTYPDIDKIFNDLVLIGIPRLSGTGSTVFVEFDSLEDALEGKEKFPELVLVKSLDRSPLMQIIE